jgi:hypothetical protein
MSYMVVMDSTCLVPLLSKREKGERERPPFFHLLQKGCLRDPGKLSFLGATRRKAEARDFIRV